nr:putative retrotransposon protein [Tanacetum cinerariifolium]
MTTLSTNNSVFKGFFEKQKLTGPNFIDWYRQLRIVLSIEDRLDYLEQPIPPAPVAHAGQHVAPEILTAHNAWIKGSKEIAGLMLMTMKPEIQQNLEPLQAHEMLKELKTMFAQQAEQELLQTTSDFYSCRQEEGQSVSSYVLKMKGYIDNLERLGHPVTLGLGVSLILIGLRKEYDGFVQNYNMHSMGKTVNELHAMLKLNEQTLPKCNAPALNATRAGYPKEMMGYSFYYPPKNKVLVARNAEFLENSLIDQEASGSLKDLKIIQEEDAHHSLDTSLNHEEDDLEIDEPQSDIVPIRRSTRTRHAPDRMRFYIDAEEHELGDLGEPANYKVALLDPESEKWLNAMNVKMQSMKDNEVWVLVELPPNGKTVGSKRLFKKKTDMDGNVHIYKARLVAKGYTQTSRIDYEETFSPVAYIRAIRILIAIDAYYDYEIWQIDVKTAFLNGYLNEEVYMEQPEGFVNPKYSNCVCKLKRSIYGLKQTSRQWNKRFDDEIKKFGFTQNRDEPCVYLKASRSNITFLILYVDDILIMGNSIPMLQSVKTYLGKCFAMKDLGEAAYILGIKIYRDRSKRLIGLCQSAYIKKILKRYCMENSKRESIPMQEKLKLSKSQGASTPAELKRMQNVPYVSAVGSIMYVVRCTRPDVANTKDMFLVYGGDLKRELRVSCYTHAGYLTDPDDLKSQSGYVFVLNGGAVDWKSAKQSIFVTSFAEAEYIAAFDVSKEVVWVRKFISGLGVVPTIEEPISMYCDNTGAIVIANESGITKGARHFRAKVHCLREVIEFGDIKLEKVHIDDNLAGPFTKALAFPKHS